MSNNPSVNAQQDRFTGIFPPTLVSASTITPFSIINFVSGTVQVATITPLTSGPHLLVLIFTDAVPGAFLTTGNIAVAVTPVQNVALLLAYDPRTTKYYSITSGSGGGGVGTPSLPLNSLQYDNAGSFGGASGLLTDGSRLSFAANIPAMTNPITLSGGDDGNGRAALVIDSTDPNVDPGPTITVPNGLILQPSSTSRALLLIITSEGFSVGDTTNNFSPYLAVDPFELLLDGGVGDGGDLSAQDITLNVHGSQKVNVQGPIQATDYRSSDGSPGVTAPGVVGATATFEIKNGLIVGVS